MYIRAQKTADREVTYTADDGSTMIRRNGAKAWRCCNPGNLAKGIFSSQHGAIGAYDEEAVFPDRETGEKAMRALLRGGTYGPLSIYDAISRYAPAHENDVEDYVSHLEKQTHLTRDRTINALDAKEFELLVKAMQKMEGWTEGETVMGGASTAPTTSTRLLRVSADGLNVRATPSLQGTIVGGLSRGTLVDWLDISSDQYFYRIQKGNLTGWSSHKYLVPLVENAPDSTSRPWMVYAYAEKGVKEVSGNQANARIVEYLHSTNLGSPYDNSDETPWCSGFVNWCVEKAHFAGTDSARALSWASWGRGTDNPVAGDIVVFNWGNGRGHVGFFVPATAETVKVLGGNQENEVNIKGFARNLVYRFRQPV